MPDAKPGTKNEAKKTEPRNPLETEQGKDFQLDRYRYKPQEQEHHYGPNVHLLPYPTLLSRLARLCSPETNQPLVNECIESIYRSLLERVIDAEFPTIVTSKATRMKDSHPHEAVFRGPVLDHRTRAVSVNLARAGTLPSHFCYDMLNRVLDPQGVRQDHISIARATNPSHEVVGSVVSGHKIGGPIEGAILLIPDPMAATGGTLIETLKLYESLGKPQKIIAIHCIVTPEYLLRVRNEAPQVVVYAVRVDRGLSPPEILTTVPGTEWAREKGLNANGYIVPGGGGFGEILNNAFV